MQHYKELIQSIYRDLMAEYGPQGWWPLTGRIGERGFDIRGYHPGIYPVLYSAERFEIITGAVLTQNTSWKNVRAALDRLFEYLDASELCLEPETLLEIGTERLSQLIRPSGYYNQKAKKLFLLSGFIKDLKAVPLRGDLLELWGIGPETADSMLLYAYNVPVFVIDAYTRRILRRTGGLSAGQTEKEYHHLQSMFQAAFPPDSKLYQEFHALLVIHAKQRCKARVPVCAACPLRQYCKNLV